MKISKLNWMVFVRIINKNLKYSNCMQEKLKFEFLQYGIEKFQIDQIF